MEKIMLAIIGVSFIIQGVYFLKKGINCLNEECDY